MFQLSRRLDDLLDLLLQDIEVKDIDAAELALRVLQEKVDTISQIILSPLSMCILHKFA